MKRLLLCLLSLVLLFNISACTGRDTDIEMGQKAEDTTISSEPNANMVKGDNTEDTERQKTFTE